MGPTGSPRFVPIARTGIWNSGVEIAGSIFLLGFTSPSSKSKNVCQPMKRRGARRPPLRSSGSSLSNSSGSNTKPKNGSPSSPARLARYDGRIIEWPNR